MTYSDFSESTLSTTKQAANPRFFGQVMTWLAAAFGAATIGTLILGPIIPQDLVLPLYFVALGALILSAFVRKVGEALAGPLAIIIPTILGIALYGTLNSMVAAGGGGIIVMALLGTAIVFGSMAVWGWTTTKDVSGWGKPLFFMLLGVIAISLLNTFVFGLPLLSLLISVVVLVLFSIYTIVDIQSLKNAQKYGTSASPATYALNIFLNIYNIFVSLLRILSFFR